MCGTLGSFVNVLGRRTATGLNLVVLTDKNDNGQTYP
jgi:hypothetical protein